MTHQATPQTISIILLTQFSHSYVENIAYIVHHHNYNFITIKNLKNNDQHKHTKFTTRITLANIEIKQELCLELHACGRAFEHLPT